MKCYELIDVKIKSELIQARPIRWDREIADGFGNDKNGEPVESIEFHTTCPYCGNLIQFTRDSLFIDVMGNKYNITCLSCKAGNLPAMIENKGSERTINPISMVFIDPIAEGLFDVEVDEERLLKLESTKSH